NDPPQQGRTDRDSEKMNHHSPSIAFRALLCVVRPSVRARSVWLGFWAEVQRAFEPGHIPILPEFPAIAGKCPYMAKPEALVQRDRRGIRQRHARHNAMDVLACY